MTVKMAIVGLGFGAEFIPIYQAHPDVELVAICQRNRSSLDRIGDQYQIEGRYESYEELLESDDIDAVHLNTPIPLHGQQSIAGLEAGKHVACTVPMATSMEECARIVAAADASGRNYMMMETVVYSREFLYVKEMLETGELGRLQFLRGAHHQDMSGWPEYWEGLPPMHYATHAVSPLLALSQRKAAAVSCLGSGRIAEPLQSRYGSPFAVESAHIALEGGELAAEVSRSLFDTAREYVESFDVYGSKASFEWAQTEAGQPVVFHGEKPHHQEVPDYAHLLPEPIRRFTTGGVYGDDNEHLSFIQGGGHGGSHPHMAHEFVRSIIEGRASAIDARTAANWTGVGLCAHESAMAGGKRVELPTL